MNRRSAGTALAWAGLGCLLLCAAALPAAGKAAKPGRVKAPPVPIVFSSIPWLMPADSALAQLATRGYREAKAASGKDLVVCLGRLFDHEALVHGSLDEQRRVVRWVVTVVADGKRDDYASMRGVYDDIVTESAAKYGPRGGWVERFRFPYEKGDGREAQALRDGEATIRSEWAVRGGDRLTAEMDRALSVVLTYECPEWAALQARLRAKKARDL